MSIGSNDHTGGKFERGFSSVSGEMIGSETTNQNLLQIFFWNAKRGIPWYVDSLSKLFLENRLVH